MTVGGGNDGKRAGMNSRRTTKKPPFRKRGVGGILYLYFTASARTAAPCRHYSLSPPSFPRKRESTAAYLTAGDYRGSEFRPAPE